MPPSNRNFEVVTEASDVAEHFCDRVLRVAADFFNGEPFEDSDTEIIERKQNWLLEDGGLYVGFRAAKLEPQYTEYQVTVAQQRPWEDGEYWPPLDESDIQDDDIDDDFIMIGGSYEDDDDDEADDEAIAAMIEEQEKFRSVREIWKFMIDDEDFIPFKEVRWEYYFGTGVRAGYTALHDRLSLSRIFSENPEEDVDLQILDKCLSNSFSEKDLADIIGSLRRLGCTAIPADWKH